MGEFLGQTLGQEPSVNTRELPPFQRHSETSREAALAKLPTASSQRERVYHFLQDHGPCTAQELSAWLDLSGDSVRPRLVELARCGAVADSGERRRTVHGRRAVVWRALEVSG